MKDIKVLGIDLAKNVFQLHGTNRYGKRILKKRLSREKLLPFMPQLPACLIGIEACGDSHYWARAFQEIGHTVKMKQKAALSNHIRGLLGEYGVIIPQGIHHIKQLPEILDDNIDKITPKAKATFLKLYEQFNTYLTPRNSY